MRIRNEQPLMRPQSIRSKLFWGVLICGCLGLAGSFGYRVGRARQSSSWSLGVQQRVPFEFYLTEQSFSEVVNTRARIEALSIQFLTDLLIPFALVNAMGCGRDRAQTQTYSGR
jgi:hypothetical protein